METYKFYDEDVIYKIKKDIITTDYDGFLHSYDDKPAKVSYEYDGTVKRKLWYKNGRLHRENDKPALISFGTCNGKIYAEKYYYINGQLHRTNGEAIIGGVTDGFYYYFLYGKRYNVKEEWEMEVNRILILNEL